MHQCCSYSFKNLGPKMLFANELNTFFEALNILYLILTITLLQTFYSMLSICIICRAKITLLLTKVLFTMTPGAPLLHTLLLATPPKRNYTSKDRNCAYYNFFITLYNNNNNNTNNNNNNNNKS